MLLSLSIEISESNKQGSLDSVSGAASAASKGPRSPLAWGQLPRTPFCPAILVSCDLYDTFSQRWWFKTTKTCLSQFFRPEFPSPYYWAEIEVACGHLYPFQPLVTASLPPLTAASLEASRPALSSHRPLLWVHLYGICTSLSLLRTLVNGLRALLQDAR